MGDLIRLPDRRGRRPGGNRESAGGRTLVYFDLACPFSYLALERVDRLLESVRWRPTCAEALHRGNPWLDPASERAREAAERRAPEPRLPLVWPADPPPTPRSAMPAADHPAGVRRRGGVAPAAAPLALL